MDRSRQAASAEPPVGGVELTGGLDGALHRWVADARVDEAARRRAREHWMQIQAEESATLCGTLVELSERSAPVVLVVAGRRVQGTVAGVGADFVVIREGGAGHVDHDVLVSTEAIESLRTGGSEAGTAGGGDHPVLETTLAAILVPVARDRPEVLVRTRTGTELAGALRSAGTDVLSVAVGGDPLARVWVPLAAVSTVTILY